MTKKNPKSLYEKIMSAEKENTIQDIVDKENSKRIRVHMPCKVVAINGSTVDVEIQGSEDSGYGFYTKFPTLLDLPIIYNNYTSKAFIITPVQIGDTGLVEFLDFNASNFQNDGNIALTSDEYYHSINNGVFINGFIPNSNVVDISGKNNNLLSKDNNPTMLEEPTDEIWDRPQVKNEDGSISTAVSITIGIDYKGKEAFAVIPTCYDGEIHSENDAIERFYKTHKHFGIFSNSGKAQDMQTVEEYSTNVHNAQEDYAFNSDMPIIIGLHNKLFEFKVNNSGDVIIRSNANIKISSSNVNIDGSNVNISGGNTTIDGKNFLNHKHSNGNQGANTGGVV